MYDPYLSLAQGEFGTKWEILEEPISRQKIFSCVAIMV